MLILQFPKAAIAMPMEARALAAIAMPIIDAATIFIGATVGSIIRGG